MDGNVLCQLALYDGRRPYDLPGAYLSWKLQEVVPTSTERET